MAKKNLIENLYDTAANDDGSFNEEKLRRELEDAQKKWGKAKWNKERFAEEEPKFFSCRNYNPCPICDKCKNKASHLYIKCRTCKIPICTHTYEDKIKMIRRDNFKIKLSDDVIQLMKDKAEEVLGG